MCGITGAYAFTQKGQQSLANIRAANDALFKRGPDSGSIYETIPVTLGHRRLSIIDTSCAGDQPMMTRDGRYTIVFNGEIFNFQQLQGRYLTQEERNDLRSHSDTEVFLTLYQKLNVRCFELLDGFFAAAIYDKETQELVCVRDRYGKKPFVYFQDEDQLIFASELKALFKAGIPKEINWDLLPVYLQLNYVPQPYSLIQNVRKLKPGHYLRIKGGEVQEEAYYELRVMPELYNRYNYEEAKKLLVQCMDDAVRLRMIADVPLGAFLSGGIDSSVVVALASRYTDKLNTFSIGYKDNPFFDETAYAKLVAKKYNTEHTVFSLGNDDFLKHVHDVLDYIDEPFADSSAIPEFILSYYTRKHVTVALSGDGGDEVFAGYNKHKAEWQMRRGGLLNLLARSGAPLWKVLPQNRNHPVANKFRQLNRFATGACLSAAERYWKWASLQSEKASSALLHPLVRQKINSSLTEQIKQEFTGSINGGDFNEVLLADMELVLVSDMLVKVDLMSMANSLEVRSPFLDHGVVDLAFSLPTSYKINDTLKKRIVQDAFRPLLPVELYNRPKQGFDIPLLHWFRTELWPEIDGNLLSDTFIREQQIFDEQAIKQLKQKLRSSNPEDSHENIWALLVFQHWWKKYLA